MIPSKPYSALKNKSLKELQAIRLVLLENQQDWKDALVRAGEEQRTREAALQENLSLLEELHSERSPLAKELENLEKERGRITRSIEALRKELSNITSSLDNTTKELTAKESKIHDVDTQVRKIRDLINLDKANLPNIEQNCESLEAILQEVEELIAVSRRTQTRSTGQIIQQQQQLLEMLCGGIDVSSEEESASIPIPTLFQLESYLVTDEPSEVVSPPQALDPEPDSTSSSDVEAPSSKKARLVQKPSVESPQSKAPPGFRTELLAKISEVREVFRQQHKKIRLSEEPILCVRQDGQWRVPEEERVKFKVVGYQGTKNNTQSFFVRVKQQVISQKLLDTGCGEDDERVEALFQDPRDCSDVYLTLLSMFEYTK